MHRLSLVVASGDCSLVAVLGPLILAAFLLKSTGFRAQRLQYLWLLGSRAQALWHLGLVVPWQVESSQIRDRTCVSCISRCILYL